MLATAVLGNGSVKAKASGTKRANQKAHAIENLIPTEIMVRIKDTGKYSTASMLSLVATAAKSLGLENPDITTLYRMTAIVAAASGASMSQHDVWTHMNTLQKYVKSKARGSSKVEYITLYPPTAELLPSDIQKQAYPDGILPPEISWPELDTVLGVCRMKGGRLGSPQDKAKKPSTLPSKPQNEPAEIPPAMPSADVFRFRADSKVVPSVNGSLAQAYQLAAHGHSELKGASGDICSKCKKAIHDEDCQPADKILDEEDDDDEKDADSELDAFEHGVIGAYDTRAGMKRPAKAGAPMKAVKPMVTAMKAKSAMKKKVMKAMTLKAMKAMKSVVMKKPATRIKKVVPGWSDARRLKQYPEGCPKCRDVPGCTFSCFSYRGEI